MKSWDKKDWTSLLATQSRLLARHRTHSTSPVSQQGRWHFATLLQALNSFHQYCLRFRWTQWSWLFSTTLWEAGGLLKTFCFFPPFTGWHYLSREVLQLTNKNITCLNRGYKNIEKCMYRDLSRGCLRLPIEVFNFGFEVFSLNKGLYWQEMFGFFSPENQFWEKPVYSPGKLLI